MRTLLYTILGIILGLILGVVGPIGFSFFMAWLDDFKPGAGAPTAFAIMLPFTGLAGACFGGSMGYRKGKSGLWFSNTARGKSKSLLQLIADPLPLTHHTIQELTYLSPESTDMFDKRQILLDSAEQQYRSQLDAGNIFTLIVLCVFVPLIGVPLAIGISAKRYCLRKRIKAATDAWSQQP